MLHDLWTDNGSTIRGKVRGQVQFCTCLMGIDGVSRYTTPAVQPVVLVV